MKELKVGFFWAKHNTRLGKDGKPLVDQFPLVHKQYHLENGWVECSAPVADDASVEAPVVEPPAEPAAKETPKPPKQK